jgi:tRNA(fMet)-specific endonuclease VapC
VKRYLLDTNICIYFLKGQFDLDNKINAVGPENCFISEITLAELKFGVEKSIQKEKNRQTLKKFERTFSILPIYSALDIYAAEKARLQSKGKSLDEFDLLIGATAIAGKLILITRNVSDFNRMNGIDIQDWTINEKKLTKKK